MIRNKFVKAFQALVFIALGHVAHAQSTTVSPYSRFGPGELLFKGFAHQRSMGGLALAQAGVARLNVSNPASYAYDSLMVLEFGLMGEHLRLEQAQNTSEQWNGHLEYLVMGFPVVRNKVGLALGMIPYSGTGYSVQTKESISDGNTLTTTYEGEGGYNRYFVGTAFKITPGLSLGANASYLFGTTNQSRKADFSSSSFFSTNYSNDITANDFYFDFGLHWETRLKGDMKFAAGLTYSFAQVIDAKRSVLWQNYSKNIFGNEIPKDTVQYIEEEKGSVTIPSTYGIGFQLSQRENFLFGADFIYQEWGDFESYNGQDSLENSWRLSVGGQYVRDPKGNNYFERIQYRGGAYYYQTFLNLRNTSLNDYGLDIGVGLPLRKAFQSMINIGVELGQRGTTDNNLIKESYTRIIFGITLNEDWFRKRRFD